MLGEAQRLTRMNELTNFITSDNFFSILTAFLFTYSSLSKNSQPLNLLSFIFSKIENPILNTLNALMHFMVVAFFVKILSGPILSDSGKNFFQLADWKIL